MSTQKKDKKDKRDYKNEGLYKVKGTRFNAWMVAPESLALVGVDTDDKGHALYDERVNMPLDEGLVRNIMKRGVLNPIIVRKNPQGIFEVVDGRQRTRAAREANIRLKEEGSKPIRVPVHVKGGEYREMFGAMIALNECRQDDDKITKARKANRLIDKGYAVEDVAVEFGVTPLTIKDWLKLLTLEPALLAAVERREISASEAIKAVGAPEAQQLRLAEEARRAPVKPKKGRKRLVNVVPPKGAIQKKIDEIRGINPMVAIALQWAIGLVDEEFLMDVLQGKRQFSA